MVCLPDGLRPCTAEDYWTICCGFDKALEAINAVHYVFVRGNDYWEEVMTDKELRHLSRSELLEMLIELIEENDKLKSRLEQAEAQLNDRTISINNAGSIAEAALMLNGIFQSAENAAQQYLENAKRLSTQQEEMCRDMQAKAEAQAAEIMHDAETYSRQVHAEADDYMKHVIMKAYELLKNQNDLREIIQSYGEVEPDEEQSNFAP